MEVVMQERGVSTDYLGSASHSPVINTAVSPNFEMTKNLLAQFDLHVPLANRLSDYLRMMESNMGAESGNQTFVVNLMILASDGNETVLVEKWQFKATQEKSLKI